MSSDDSIRRALEELARADRFRRVPPHLEERVLEAFDRETVRRRAPRLATTRYVFAVAAVAAAVVAIVTTMDFDRAADESLGRAGNPANRVVPSGVAAMPATMLTDDVVHEVHMRVPRTMLPLLGVPIIEPDAAGMVNVELLLGNDGLARAVRIVP